MGQADHHHFHPRIRFVVTREVVVAGPREQMLAPVPSLIGGDMCVEDDADPICAETELEAGGYVVAIGIGVASATGVTSNCNSERFLISLVAILLCITCLIYSLSIHHLLDRYTGYDQVYDLLFLRIGNKLVAGLTVSGHDLPDTRQECGGV